MTFLSINLF